MPRDSIKYKSIDPGCVLDIQALSGDFTEERLITSARRHRRPSAGLIVETDQLFFPGTMVLMDIAIEKSAMFRSRGMVSWSVAGPSPNLPYKIGVMIFAMEKLAPDGLPFDDTPIPTSEPSHYPDSGQPVQEAQAGSGDNLDDIRSTYPAEPVDENAVSIGRRRSTLPPPAEFAIQFPLESMGNPMGNSWELLTQCGTSAKTMDWQRAIHFPGAVKNIDYTSEKQTMVLTNPKFRHRVTGMTLRGATDSSNSEAADGPKLATPAPPTFVSFGKSVDDLDINISVDPEFDVEGAMIRAFDQMHELFGQTDRVGAANFATNLARSVITSEAAICHFVSDTKYELTPVATSPAANEPWSRLPRSARLGLYGAAIQTGNALRIDNPAKHSEYQFDDGGLETRNLLIAPVSCDGYLIGTLELRNSPRESGFTSGESDVLTYIGSSLAEFIHNSLPDEAPPDMETFD